MEYLSGDKLEEKQNNIQRIILKNEPVYKESNILEVIINWLRTL
jgi:hypothetical protein